MLRIRANQLESLRAGTASRYRQQLAEEISDFAPQLTEVAGRDALSTLVDRVWDDAHDAGYERKGSIKLWAQLALALGVEFPTDPQFAWLGRWTQPGPMEQEGERARLLHFHAVRYLDTVRGPENVNGVAALRRALKLVSDLDIFAAEAMYDAAPTWLQDIHPWKCAFLGPELVAALIHHARQEATDHGLDEPLGRSVVLGLMFAFGAGVFRDPMYPWVAHSVSRGIASERARRLAQRARTYLAEALRQIDGG